MSSFLSLHAFSVGLVNSGLFFSAFLVACMAGRLVFGPPTDRLGRRVVAAPVVRSLAVGLLPLMRLNRHVIIAVAGALIGLGFATAHTAMFAMVVDKTTARERSEAVSFYANAFDLGSATGSMGLREVARHSYSALWGVTATFAFAGFRLISFVLPHDGTKKTAEPKGSAPPAPRAKRSGAAEPRTEY